MSPTDHATDLARELAGNHRRFTSFAWFDRPADDAEWTIYYVSDRDTERDPLTASNAAVIARILEPYTEGDDPDVVGADANHWAVGYVNGWAVRVYRDGAVTPAFAALAELICALESYPVLDDDDFSRRETEQFASDVADTVAEILRHDDDDTAPSPELLDAVISEMFDRQCYPEVRESDVRAAIEAVR